MPLGCLPMVMHQIAGGTAEIPERCIPPGEQRLQTEAQGMKFGSRSTERTFWGICIQDLLLQSEETGMGSIMCPGALFGLYLILKSNNS